MKKYEKAGSDIGSLVQKKNEAYGSSFEKSGEIIKILYPNGVQPEQYADMLAMTRVLDKLFRIATDKDAFGESPWKDIAGYAILMNTYHEERVANGSDEPDPQKELLFD
jgi:hypothetical protein